VDDFTFDAVARAVAAGASRRRAIRLLAAGVLTAWLPGRVLAAPARQDDACEPGLTYCPGADGAFVCVVGDCVCGDLIFCNGVCVDVSTDPSNCGGCGVVCDSGVCDAGGCVVNATAVCAEGLTDCTGALDCVDLSSDSLNCGACGTVCDSRVCEAGSCVQVGCEAGLTYCEEQPGWEPAGCYDLSSDYHHCGSCMHQCPSAGPAPMACIGGECQPTACPEEEGWVDCTGNLDCAFLPSDANNCGTCGNVCASGVCEDGSCFGGCGAGLAYCPARTIGIGAAEEPYELAAGCYDLFSDRNHCGSCDVTCPTTVGCYGGECTLPPCEGGLVQCEGTGCLDLLSDPAHCGGCDIVCAAGEVCEGGVCGPNTTCAAGLTYCPEPSTSGGLPEGCYDLSSDYYRCGSCDTSCPIASAGPMACIEGQCQYDCEPGLSVCTAPPAAIFCTDLAADPQNCGACSVVCAAGEVCEAGQCVATTPATSDATPSTTSAQDEVANAQDAAPEDTGASERPRRARRDRTDQDTTVASGATSSDAGSTTPERKIQPAGSSAPESVLAWPFDAKAGQWTIVHGYRAEDEGTNSAATPAAEGRDFARLALEFAVCPVEDVDAAAGTCNLGNAGSDPSWDREATQGSAVVSPVDGTVAWTDGEASCLAVGIDIAGHAGYRLALFNVEGELARGQSVKRGKRMGKLARRGCERGDRLRMALYQPQQGTSDDPVAAREGVPFSGEWVIGDCEYPDDKRTVEQYRGELVPCKPEDEVSASS
jgi:hypothetical protein